MNGRPITELSSDPNDLTPLTPSHLLFHTAGEVLPPGTFHKDHNIARRKWRRVQYLADIFWGVLTVATRKAKVVTTKEKCICWGHFPSDGFLTKQHVGYGQSRRHFQITKTLFAVLKREPSRPNWFVSLISCAYSWKKTVNCRHGSL